RANAQLYSLSLHDALPICSRFARCARARPAESERRALTRCRGQPYASSSRFDQFPYDRETDAGALDLVPRFERLEYRPDPFVILDRKSTRLNSSHVKISYA